MDHFHDSLVSKPVCLCAPRASAPLQGRETSFNKAPFWTTILLLQPLFSPEHLTLFFLWLPTDDPPGPRRGGGGGWGRRRSGRRGSGQAGCPAGQSVLSPRMGTVWMDMDWEEGTGNGERGRGACQPFYPLITDGVHVVCVKEGGGGGAGWVGLTGYDMGFWRGGQNNKRITQ